MAPNPHLHLGTSSWTAKGWLGKFYPSGTKPADFITHYAERYSTVEIDATFYATPAESTVAGWHEKTPEGFIFAAKAPQVITHDKFLDDCRHEVSGFLKAMSGLGEKLGPILFQFPYYAKKTNVNEDDFLHRLREFLPTLPEEGFKFAVEVRNKTWINDYLFEILHNHNITLALIDHPWMAPPAQLFKSEKVRTGDFMYLRWLGDRYALEKITKVFDKTVVDRARDIERWVQPVKDVLTDGVEVYGYVNNHYGGYAPDNVDQLRKALEG